MLKIGSQRPTSTGSLDAHEREARRFRRLVEVHELYASKFEDFDEEYWHHDEVRMKIVALTTSSRPGTSHS